MITDKLASIGKILAMQPKLSGADREEYDRIWAKIARANSDKRRAGKRGDAKLLAAADRAIARARDAREAIVSPYVGNLWAPTRIVAKSERHWHGRSGTGIHRQECEMILDYKDLSGPEYRTVCVLKDEGGPPTNARAPFENMGVAWHALADQIKRGNIVVLGEEASS